MDKYSKPKPTDEETKEATQQDSAKIIDTQQPGEEVTVFKNPFERRGSVPRTPPDSRTLSPLGLYRTCSIGSDSSDKVVTEKSKKRKVMDTSLDNDTECNIKLSTEYCLLLVETLEAIQKISKDLSNKIKKKYPQRYKRTSYTLQTTS